MKFSPLTRADIARLQPFLTGHPFRSCDFTVGGIFLWADAFGYSYAISHDTLFISGRAVNDSSLPAFSLPLGRLPLHESVGKLLEYCEGKAHPLVLSSVPEEALPLLIDLGARRVEQLTDWADYVYDAEALSTFAGKKLAKKRNHINRFAADHPDARLRDITAADTDALTAFYERLHSTHTGPMALYDREMTLRTIKHLGEYPFEAMMLEAPGCGIAAFAVGEAVGDTLHVHIEKMDHEIAGSGETVCQRFTAEMCRRHPSIRWVNRQDDSGDMGLRRAKLSLHPAFLVHKYNVAF